MVDALRSRAWSRLHAARAGQRRGVGAPRARRAPRRAVPLRDGRRRADPGGHQRRSRDARTRAHRFHRHLRAARRATSTPPRRCAGPRCCTCSARLVDDDIPMNDGCLKPLEIIIPEGCMLNPRYPAAVVAGNVETSQVHHRRALRRARRDGRGPGHDEQLHLRQRALPVLRDDLRRLRRRARISTAPTRCTRT